MEPQADMGMDQGFQRPTISILGQHIALGPLRDDLLPTYQRWHQQFAALRMISGQPEPTKFDENELLFGEMSFDDEQSWFTIYEIDTWQPIGVTGLIDIDPQDNSAEFFLHIGEIDAQGRDHGSETGRLMLDYSFAALGLRSVFLMDYEFNLSGLRACETAGFREFGRQRQAHFAGGRLWDVVYLECLAADFVSPSLGTTIFPAHPHG